MSAARLDPVPWPVFRGLYETLLSGSLDTTEVLNITRTWAHNPALMQAQRPYQDHLKSSSSLPRRDQELAVLRIGWLCSAEYEFGQHTLFARRFGVSDAEIVRVTRGPSEAGWSRRDALILTCVDELYEGNTLTEATWQGLTREYSPDQLIELISVIGRYWTVSVVARSLNIQRESGTPGFPSQP